MRGGNFSVVKHDVKTMTFLQRSLMFRALVGAVASAGFVLAVASPALAHTEFDIEEVAPGSIVSLNLFVENESSTAGTTMIELRFPEPLVVVDLPAVDGWTIEPVEGTVGAEALGVLWSRDTAGPGDDPTLPLTIGPLPAVEGRLQFKVVQTYSDGSVSRWIEDWPVDGPRPQQPGPLLDLVVGAPGTIPPTTIETTTTTATATSTTPAPATTAVATTLPEETTSAVDTTEPATTDGSVPTTSVDAGDDDSLSTGLLVGIAVVVVAGAAVAFVVVRRRKR